TPPWPPASERTFSYRPIREERAIARRECAGIWRARSPPPTKPRLEVRRLPDRHPGAARPQDPRPRAARSADRRPEAARLLNSRPEAWHSSNWPPEARRD